MSSANADLVHATAAPHAYGGYTNPYDVKFRPQLGWTKQITIRDDYRLFKKLPQFAHWTKEDHIRASETLRTIAEIARAAHVALVHFGASAYGMNGPLIAGGFHDDWPGELKDACRSFAHKVSRQLDISLAHWRAAGRTSKTWRKD